MFIKFLKKKYCPGQYAWACELPVLLDRIQNLLEVRDTINFLKTIGEFLLKLCFTSMFHILCYLFDVVSMVYVIAVLFQVC
jgi:hypothetical protein